MSRLCNYKKSFSSCFPDDKQINPEKVLFYVYINYRNYGLQYMDEDDRYDFILSLLPIFMRLAKTFERSKATLEHYVFYLICKHRQSWRKRYIHKNLTESIVLEDCKMNYMEHVSSPEEDYIANQPHLEESYTQYSSRLLILGLKASWYLKDIHIEHLAAVTKMKKSTIVSYVQQLNLLIEKKIRNSIRCIQRRNRCYILKTRYRMELEKLRSTTPLIYYKIEENMIKKQQLWNKKLKNDRQYLVVTPVRYISAVLAIPQKKLENDLRFIKRLYSQRIDNPVTD